MASYPVGSQIVSEHLADIPQADDIELRFSNDPADHRHGLVEVLTSRRSYPLLRARYYVWTYSSTAVSRRNPIEPSWSLYVYPVLREIRATVSELLKDEALPALKQWFCAERNEVWYFDSQSLTVYLHPRELNLSYEE